jgi:hypothetical protein
MLEYIELVVKTQLESGVVEGTPDDFIVGKTELRLVYYPESKSLTLTNPQCIIWMNHRNINVINSIMQKLTKELENISTSFDDEPSEFQKLLNRVD